jgi:hypothetical protein
MYATLRRANRVNVIRILYHKSMPNWCNNTLTITGNEEDIKRFIKQAKQKNTEENKKTELSLGNFLPVPTELENTQAPNNNEVQAKKLVKKYGAKDWYDWRIKNWGTKWDITAKKIRRSNGKVCYGFESAWSPPCEAVLKMSEQYNELAFTLEYDEPGMAFKGCFECYQGSVQNDESGEMFFCQQCYEEIEEGEGEICENCRK